MAGQNPQCVIDKNDINRLHDRIDDVARISAETQAAVAKMSGFCVSCQKVIQGNGQPPLVQRLAMLELSLKDQEKDRKEQATNKKERMAFRSTKELAIISAVVSTVTVICQYAVPAIASALSK